MATLKTTTKLNGYRADTHVYYSLLKKRHKTPFSNKHRLSDEIRWAALYCTLEEFNAGEIINRSSLYGNKLNQFFKYYGIDQRKRDLIVKESN